MAAPAKFLFDVDFAAPAKDPNAGKEHLFTAEEVAKQVADAEASQLPRRVSMPLNTKPRC